MSETLWSDHEETYQNDWLNGKDTTEEIGFEESLVGDKNVYPHRK